MCPFDHDTTHLPERAHDFPRPITPELYPLTFQDDALNRLLSYIRRYLTLGNNTEWYHVMLKYPVHLKFINLIEDEEHQCQTVPVGCHCDGGKDPDPSTRQHRHMVVGCHRPGYFLNNVWLKIKLTQEEKPRKQYSSHHYEKIGDAAHFVNTLFYVSKPQSKCYFSGETTKKNNHFLFTESYPKSYKLIAFMLWENGLHELLTKQCKNLPIGPLVHSPVYFDQNEMKYHIKIEDIPGIELGQVMPVDRHFQPCTYPTAYFLHLLDGEKMYFDYNDYIGNLDVQAWLRKQAELGNAMYHAVGKKPFTPRPYHQGAISTFKPVVDECRAARAENEELSMQMFGATQTIATLKKENDTLNDQNQKLKIKNCQLEMRKN